MYHMLIYNAFLPSIDRQTWPHMGVNPVTHLFLDTEWADAAGEQLVSLALLSEDGTHRFYAEIDPLPTPTTLFVRTVVYPLLQRGDAALAAPQLTRRLRMFLAAVPAPRCVMFDAVNDVVLLRLALPALVFAIPGSVRWCRSRRCCLRGWISAMP